MRAGTYYCVRTRSRWRRRSRVSVGDGWCGCTPCAAMAGVSGDVLGETFARLAGTLPMTAPVCYGCRRRGLLGGLVTETRSLMGTMARSVAW